MSIVTRLGFNENEEIDILYRNKWTRAMPNEALALDDPEGAVTVRLSATLFHKLVMYRATARILASPDEEDEEGTSPLTVTFVGSRGVRLSDGSWLELAAAAEKELGWRLRAQS